MGLGFTLVGLKVLGLCSALDLLVEFGWRIWDVLGL